MWLTIIAVMLFGIVISFIIFLFLEKSEWNNVQATFTSVVDNRTQIIERELKVFSEHLRSVASLFNSLQNVSREEFNIFVKDLLIRDTSFQAISWHPRVENNQREDFEKKGKEWYPDYQIYELNPEKKLVREREKDFYFPLFYQQPFFEGAIGIDPYSSAIRKPALLKAAETGHIAITDRFIVLATKTQVNLKEEVSPPYGCLAVLAIYDPLKPIDHKPKIDLVKGFVIATLIIGDKINTALKYFSFIPINIYAFDDDASPENRLLYAYNAYPEEKLAIPNSPDELSPNPLTLKRTIVFGQHHWSFYFQAASGFIPFPWNIYIILLGSLLMTTIFCMLVYFLVKGAQDQHLRLVLEKQVAQRTHQLNESVIKLKDAQERLVAQEKMSFLGTMASGIAQELKDPLNKMIHCSNLTSKALTELNFYAKTHMAQLEKVPEIPSLITVLKTNLEVISTQENKADAIVQKMIEHSYRISREFLKVNISNLIERVIEIIYNRFPDSYPNLVVKIKRDFDLAVKEANLVKQDIERVLINLLDNACYSVFIKKKTAPASYEPFISIQTINLGDTFEIRIRDNGVGISLLNKDKIFTPFFTTKPTGEGVGLGLSLSYNIIVKEHDGSFTFQSEEGEFAEFIITLPYKG